MDISSQHHRGPRRRSLGPTNVIITNTLNDSKHRNSTPLSSSSLILPVLKHVIFPTPISMHLICMACNTPFATLAVQITRRDGGRERQRQRN